MEFPGDEDAACRCSSLSNDAVLVGDGILVSAVVCHAAVERGFDPQMCRVKISQVIQLAVGVLQSDFVHVKVPMVGHMLQVHHHMLMGAVDGQSCENIKYKTNGPSDN